MKYLLIFSGLLLNSCCKEDKNNNSVNTDCIQMAQNPDFVTEKLNQDYTIQFPKDYKGEGLVIEEYAGFTKFSNDVKLNYSFLCPTDCIKFYGGPLNNPIPNSIIGSTINSTVLFDNHSQDKSQCRTLDTNLYHRSTNRRQYCTIK
jgi:hypothetical protein